MAKQNQKQEKGTVRMVTRGMAIEEVIEVLREDLHRNVQPKTWLKHQFLNRKVAQQIGSFPCGVETMVISTPVMQWGVRFYALSRQEWSMQTKESGQFYCMVQSEAGLHVYIFVRMDTGEEAVFVFPPHFFVRYHERYWEKKSTLYGKQLIKTYLKDNLIMRYGLQPGTEERVTGASIYGASAHGIALGQVLNDYAYIFKTFISYEMTKGEQIPLYMQQKLRTERAQVEYFRTGRLADPVELEEREFQRMERLREEQCRRMEEEKRKAAEPGSPYFYVSGPLDHTPLDEETQEGITEFWKKSTAMFSDPDLVKEAIEESQDLRNAETNSRNLNIAEIKKKLEEVGITFKK